MSEISATEASNRSVDVLGAVEQRGRAVVATAASGRHGTGADLRRILGDHPPDVRWADDLQAVRRFDDAAAAGSPERGTRAPGSGYNE